ncbi:MAG: hypothetical protein HYW77_03600 [Parcubacteria group bacterium]|nr:hypothetical protein [Parcubacteria group bacterium]
MPNFQLRFTVYFEDEDESKNTGFYTRIIIADNLNTAQRIGKGMLGEEVNSHEFLSEPLDIRETEEAPDISAWNENITWQRVLNSMNLQEQNVEFIFDTRPRVVGSKPVKTLSGWKYIDDKAEVTQKVGIKIKKPSRITN